MENQPSLICRFCGRSGPRRRQNGTQPFTRRAEEPRINADRRGYTFTQSSAFIRVYLRFPLRVFHPASRHPWNRRRSLLDDLFDKLDEVRSLLRFA